MDILKQLFREEEIKRLLEKNPYIAYQTKEHLGRIIKILANQKCNHKVLRNIINTNPEVLTRDPDDLEEMIYKCKEYGILHLEKVFDEYPFFASKYAYEVDGYFIRMKQEKKELEEAKELLEREPFRIDIEMTSE